MNKTDKIITEKFTAVVAQHQRLIKLRKEKKTNDLQLLGKNLKRFRQLKGLKQVELASKIGMSTDHSKMT